jgi:Carboxypeptidase regulatory-like domain
MNANQRGCLQGCVAATTGNRFLRFVAFGLMCLLLLAGLGRVAGGATTAGISGVVTDQTGAAVVGATVEARAVDTGISEKQQTNSDGFYSFLNLAPGTYVIEVQMAGFVTFRETGVLIDVNSAKILNVKLSVGQVSEKVEVSSDVVQLDTASTQGGEVISGDTMTAVPLVTRSYTDLLSLQPGVASVSSGLAGGQGGQFSATGFTFTKVSGDSNAGDVSVNGQRESANGFMLNGASVQEPAFSTAAIIPNLDSIAEFRIITNNFDAEYGTYAGGQINVITKSGSNGYHGSAFEFLRNQDFDAKNFFSATRDEHKQNEFGGTIGGPIKRDKLFFFGDYQGNRVILGQSGSTGQVAVPSAAERNGDFSSIAGQLTGVVQGDAWANELSTRAGYAVTNGEPYYTAGCTSTAQCVFPNAQIPQTLWTAPSKNLMQYVLPVTQVVGGNSIFTADASSEPSRLRDDKTGGRIDYNSNLLGLISTYYFFDQYLQSVPNIALPGFGSNFTGRSQVVNIGDSKTFGNGAVNELRFGYTRLHYLIHAPTGGEGVTPGTLGFAFGPDTLGISPSQPAYAHVPNIHFNDFSFGASGGPLGVTENTYQALDNYRKILGTHTLSIGANYRFTQMVEYNLGSNGDFTFNGNETGDDFADFLIGAPANYSQGQGYPSYGLTRYFGAYGQDSWRFRSNITFNYGLRWDISRPWSEEHNEIQTLIPGVQSLVYPGSPTGWLFPGDPGVPTTLAPTRYHNFAPRAGMAYSPNFDDGFLRKLTGGTGKTSIRAGWGLFYTTFEGATNFNEIGDAPFGAFYQSPVPPEFVTPFVDRSTGFVEGQRFPVAPPPFNASPSNPDTSINWANFLPIGTSPAFWHKNDLPYTEQYQLTIERQIGSSTLLSIGYIGAQGHRLLSSLEANAGNPATCLSVSTIAQVAPGSATCGPGGENGTYTTAAGTVINGTRGPFGNNFGSEGLFITEGKSAYNSLQVSLRQRFKTLSFLAGYTYSKSLDNSSGYGEQINYQDPNARSLSSFDMRHNFVISYDYELPINRLPGPRRLVQGWRISGITRFATGIPVTLTETDDNSLTGTGGAGAISLPIDTPNYTPGSLNISDPRKGAYFNTALFTPEALGQLGNASRRFFSGPGLNNWDMALLKDTAIREQMRLEFRCELFNAFNHAQFQSPDGNIADLPTAANNFTGTFGQSLAANPPRIMQLSLKLLF